MTSQQSDKTNKPETSTYEKIQNAQPTSAHDIPSPKSADIKIDSSTDADAKQSTDEIALLKDKLKKRFIGYLKFLILLLTLMSLLDVIAGFTISISNTRNAQFVTPSELPR